jgi:ABC-2 type transport system permease protein
MKSFLGFIIKEFQHIIRDKRTLIILFGMPLAQLLIFGYAVRNELTLTGISILDQSKDAQTQLITDKLTASGYFEITSLLEDESQIEDVFRSGEARMVLIYGPDYARNLQRNGVGSVQIITDASNPNMAQLVQSYTAAIISETSTSRPNGIIPEVRMLYNPELRSANLFVPGLIAIILMLVSALMTSIAITREKELGTMEVLLASPLHPLVIILGKVLPYLLLSILNVITVLFIAQVVFDVPFVGNYIHFFIQAMLFTITALSLGILISTITNSQQVAMMIALAGLLLPTILLSGFIFAVENMPMVLQVISNIIPARWFLVIIKGIMLKGSGIELLWKETLILVGMMMFLIFISVRKFKIRLE